MIKIIVFPLSVVIQYKKTDAIQSFLIELVIRDGKKNTYFHPKLALRFAQWCSAEFAVQVDFWLDDMLMGKNSKTLPFAPDRHTYIYRPLEEGKSPWDLMFEKPLYDQLYALDNRVNEEPYNQHPPYFAQYTIKYIYDELMDIAPKQIYEELRLLRANDNRPKGLRMLHQYLSEEGKILLCKTIGAITELVRQANNVSPYPHIKKNYLALKLAERKGQLTLPIYDEFALKGSQKIIGNYDDFHNQLIEKVVPMTVKSFLRQSAKILEINYHHIIFGVGSRFLKDIGNKQTQAIELAVEAVLKENLTVMFKTYEEYLFGEDKKENA